MRRGPGDNPRMTPCLLTLAVHDALLAARDAGSILVSCSLDLGRSVDTVVLEAQGWKWRDQWLPYLEQCRDRTIYAWNGTTFEPLSRFNGALIKLVPTEWGAPTFEIDGIKMLPTAQLSPYEDARRKVALIQPRGKTVLDTCGGLGYFAAWCLEGGAAQVISFEKNPDVIWLRGLNPWSPEGSGVSLAALTLTHADVSKRIETLGDASVDAILHDPPRFGIAGELYSQRFYDQLARVLRPRGRLFHYTGSPNKLTSRRDVPAEVSARLRKAGFVTRAEGDGIFATRG